MKTTTNRLGQTRWSAGTDTVIRTDFDTDAANLEARVLVFSQGTLAARPAPGTVGRFYTVVGDSTAPNNGRQFYDNGTAWITAAKYAEGVLSVAPDATSAALTAKGASGQTGTVLRVVNSSDAVVTSIGNDGTIVGKENVLGGTGGALVTTNTIPSKPVTVVTGANAQSANLQEWRNNGGSVLARVDNAGMLATSSASLGATSTTTLQSTTGTFSGRVTAQQGIDSTTTGTAIALVGNAGPTGFALSGVSNGVTSFLTQSNGTVYNLRSSVGDSTYTGTDSLRINNDTATTVALRVVGAASQSGNLIQVDSSANANLFRVTSNGSVVSTGSGTFNAGIYNSTPANLQGTSAPAPMEILTGTTTGAYSDTVVFRHAASSSSTNTRVLSLALKTGGETSAADSAKWAGIRAWTNRANADSPNLDLISGGQRMMAINYADNTVATFADIVHTADTQMRWPTGQGQRLQFTNGGGFGIGVQVNSVYYRAANQYWYSGGSHSNTQADPGTGGNEMMRLENNDGQRLTVGRLTLTNLNTQDSDSPVLRIGSPSGTHMQTSNVTIGTYTNANHDTQGSLYIQTKNGGGGLLQMGASDTDVRFGPRTINMGGMKFTIDYGAPANPTTGDIWIDIDA